MAYNHMEILKLLKQVDTHNLKYTQLLENSTKIVGKKYFTITRGLSLTLFRETLGTALYFFTYEYIVRLLCSSRGIHRKFASFSDFLIGGSLAGVVPLIVVYPYDSIKSQFQSGVFKQLKRPTLAETIKANYRGFGLASLRGSLLGALTFSIYEQIKGTALMVEAFTQMWCLHYWLFIFTLFMMFICNNTRNWNNDTFKDIFNNIREAKCGVKWKLKREGTILSIIYLDIIALVEINSRDNRLSQRDVGSEGCDKS